MFGTGQRTYTLGFRAVLQDRFSGPAQNVKSALTGLKEENQAFTKNLEAARNLYGGMALAGAGAIRALGGWVREGAEFEYIMKSVKAVAGATVSEYQQLSTLANTLGRETMFMPEQIASGMRYMAMAGQDADTILKTITSATNLAGATMTQLGGKLGAADIMTNILKGFNLGAEHSKRVSDLLVTATTNANVSLVDLGNSLKYVAATSSDLDIGLETTTALAMALGNAGIQGSMAGTALENMYRYMVMGLGQFRTKRQSKAWEALGLTPEDVLDVHKNLIPLDQILMKIQQKARGKGTVEIQGILKEIFGVRGKRGGSTALRTLDDFIKYQEMLTTGSTGRGATVMGSMMDTLQGDILKVISTFKSLKIAYTEAMAPIVRPMLKFLKQAMGFIQGMSSNPIGKIAIQLGSIALVGLTVNAALRAIIASFGLMRAAGLVTLTNMNNSLKTVTSTMMGFGAATKAAAASNAVGMGGYFMSPGGKKTKVPMGYAVKKSEKRGMYYMHGRGKGAKWVSKGTKYVPGMMGGMGVLGRIGGVLGKILGFLGPAAFAISVFLPLLQPLLGALRRNVDESKRMADFLAKKEKDRLSAVFNNKQVIDVLGDKTFSEMVSLLQDAKESLKNLYGIKGAIEKIEGKDGMEVLMEILPLINTSKNVKNKPIGYE